eukprot:CAMPEP_0174329680 /NCGR_PEP_ID=MMETSP0810-20121108/16054_1 /TAXON_ID=73025 ORGANISM="Eutreptiella gymnastica-like, Strain CCMP1594" /NCGR_SAMPLE_ID=MMETSP0810 /ASSEMBLY_ACC=CAM_ASM_000659 /LENGTH=31 /DNA_ID= /DNA_START= /DNA_END= /DNA_ORIENTATION=
MTPSDHRRNATSDAGLSLGRRGPRSGRTSWG